MRGQELKLRSRRGLCSDPSIHLLVEFHHLCADPGRFSGVQHYLTTDQAVIA